MVSQLLAVHPQFLKHRIQVSAKPFEAWKDDWLEDPARREVSPHVGNCSPLIGIRHNRHSLSLTLPAISWRPSALRPEIVNRLRCPRHMRRIDCKREFRTEVFVLELILRGGKLWPHPNPARQFLRAGPPWRSATLYIQVCSATMGRASVPSKLAG